MSTTLAYKGKDYNPDASSRSLSGFSMGVRSESSLC
jgi:hypothetical protein